MPKNPLVAVLGHGEGDGLPGCETVGGNRRVGVDPCLGGRDDHGAHQGCPIEDLQLVGLGALIERHIGAVEPSGIHPRPPGPAQGDVSC